MLRSAHSHTCKLRSTHTYTLIQSDGSHSFRPSQPSFRRRSLLNTTSSPSRFKLPRKVDSMQIKGVGISHVFQTPAMTAKLVQAGSRADDSAPFEMFVDNALKVLGVSDAASFDDILRARNSVLADCKDDQETVAQVEAAYDMLLMRSLTQRQAGKVVSSRILYADVKHIKEPKTRLMPQWLQSTRKNTQLSIETPTISDFGIQAVVYGALMV